MPSRKPSLSAGAQSRGLRLYALTNWSYETFPVARRRFYFINWFEDIVVSGEVKLAKPDPPDLRACAHPLCLAPASTVYIDDALR